MMRDIHKEGVNIYTLCSTICFLTNYMLLSPTHRAFNQSRETVFFSLYSHPALKPWSSAFKVFKSAFVYKAIIPFRFIKTPSHGGSRVSIRTDPLHAILMVYKRHTAATRPFHLK